MDPRTVLIVVFDGVQSLDVTGPLEVFAGANGYLAGRRRRPGLRDHHRWPGRHAGPHVQRAHPRPRRRPAGRRGGAHGPGAGRRGNQVGRRGGPGGDGLAAATRAAARRITSVCTGAFLLARAGLLDGRRATTHWAYADALERQFPGVHVDPEPIYVRDGSVVTSAGVTAGIDLALALVEEDIGREAALDVARHLVVFLRRPGGQAQFSEQLRAQLGPAPAAARGAALDHRAPGRDLSVERLAARAGLSPRQFARSFAAETGVTPGRYVDGVRLEAARRELEDTAAAVGQVARSCGYGTPEAMRRAFIRALGVSPAGYRQRFQAGIRPAAAPHT